MKAVDARPTRGDFGLPDAKIIKPGDPYSSTLYFRMAKFGRDRMPHIGAERPDEAGLKLIAEWIVGMKGNAETADLKPNAKAPDQLLASPKSAQLAARSLALGELNRAERDALVVAAAKLPAGPIRDLFEGYLPSDEKAGRKLGSNPRPKTILALKGESERGERLFWSEAVNCGKCHRVGKRGTAVGPDLSSVGKLRAREDLLESLLTPSRRIEPKYANYLALTADGRSLSGLLIKRDEAAVVLRDAQGKDVIVAAGDIQELQPSRNSLMPDGQMAGLTAQEAADLLEFLATRK
jgi:putative heme-binding domain-containing protein